VLIRVSVKTLAEFVHRRGDLYPSLGGRVTGEEGIATQRLVQRQRGEPYERELPVAAELESHGLRINVSGRVDGCDFSTTPPLVEEIKTSRADAADAERLLGSTHWAQVSLYAAMLALTRPDVNAWQLRLLYCHPDLHTAVPFDRLWTKDDLAEFLEETIARYGEWMAQQLGYRAGRDRWLEERVFPYGEFRPHQRALAGRVFQAFRDGEHLLLEAPTGSGKTMGVVYPALKALAAGHIGRLFYLTSRGTGARAAIQACADLAVGSDRIRVVDLIAKEKACLVPGMPCDERCEYANGYYDRIHGALTALLEQRHMTADVVRSVAEAHTVCPFELSLDGALWADLVIGDYNYLLDPVVRLQRFFEDGELGLLIDESHQLGERTRAMLSLDLDRADVRSALRESPPAPLLRGLKSVDRALMNLRRELPTDQEVIIDEPAGLLRAMQRVLEALADDATDLTRFPVCRLLMFNLSRWIRSSAWVDQQRFRFFGFAPTGERGARNVRITLCCLDPAGYLSATLAGYGPHIRFSGTVSPPELYQALHGESAAPAERVESPFAPDQLATLIVRDLPVYYRQRERSLPQLAQLVRDVCATAPGNYLVALPSFEYLEQLRTVLETGEGSSSDLLTVSQTPGMNDDARADFLQRFQPDGRHRIGLIVLGGVFAESVDFNHAPLAGVICVGVGLPPPSLLRDEMAAHFDATLGNGVGQTVAYRQPAMTKVLQMAGRLLRSPTDRGVLCLVDDRFEDADYRSFFPLHWRPESVRAAEVAERLENFWQAGTGLPRLRSVRHDQPVILEQ